MKTLFTEITAAFAEAVCVYIYLNFFFPDGRTDEKQKYFYYSGFFVLDLVLSFFVKSPPIRMILLTILMICISTLAQKANLLSACCAAVIFSALMVLVELIGSTILLLIYADSSGIATESPALTAFTKLIELTCICILTSVSKQNPFRMSFRSMLPLITGNIFSLLICIQLWHSSVQTPPEKAWLLMTSIFGLLYINIVLYIYLYYLNAAHETAKEKLIAQHQLELQLQYYETLNEEQERTRSMWHDMRKQLNIITQLMQSDKEKANACFNELEEQFVGLQQIVRFDNPVISSILNDVLHQTRNEKIQMDLDVMTAAELQISPLILSVVLGNTIENAVQACRMVRHRTDAWIHIHIHQHGHLLHYVIENSYNSEKDATVKRRDGIHGYGLKNVRQCVENNHGLYHIQQESQTFTVEITLNV